MWANDKVRYSYLDPEQVDTNGDCIYHLLAKLDYSDLVLQITEILCDKNVSADFYNKECMYASQYVKKKHFRLLDFLQTARMIKSSRKQINYETLKEDDNNTVAKTDSKLDQKQKSKTTEKSRKEQIQESRNNIEHLISKLPEYIEVQEIDIQKNAESKHNENKLQDNQQHLGASFDRKITLSYDNEQISNSTEACTSKESDNESEDEMSESPIESEDDTDVTHHRETPEVLLCEGSENEGDEQISVLS